MTDPAAEMKAYLRDLGQPVKNSATIRVLPPADRSQPMNLVVLDRVRQDDTPDYCIHGYAECIQCHQPVWLGHETEQVVVRGEAYPICLDCATTDIPVDRHQPLKRLRDHKRKDGPHA